MQTVTTKAIAKVAAVATGLAMATSMLSLAPIAHAASLTSAQVQSILSLLSSFGANAATISNVNAALTGQPSTTTTTTTSTSSSCSFSKDLTVGSTGADVTCLQNALKAAGYMTANSTGYFGGLTRAGVVAWQKAMNVTPAAGYFGSKSRSAWNLGGGSSSTTTTTTGPSAGTGNGLKVMLSATSPSGTVLVQGQGIGDLGDFVFANPTASPINVTALSFNRIGVSNDSTLNNVYLYNGVNRITDSAGVSSSAFSFNNAAGIFTVPAGQTYTVSVRADILTGTSGQQIGVSLVSATSNGTLDSSVSFPIMSGYQTISAASLATVDFSANSATSPTAATNISPQSAYPVWQNTVNVSTNPVWLKAMKFTNLGSIDSTYIANVRLFVDGVQVGSTLPTLASDRTASFDLSAAPKLLSTAGHVIKVVADLTGGSNRTVQFSIQRSSDALMYDNQLNQPVTPTKASAVFSAVTSNGAITIAYVTSTTGVSVTTDPASPTSNAAVGSSSVKLATFDMLASGENVKVNDLYVYAATGTPATYLANGKIFVNGVQVGSTKNLGYSAGTETDFSLGSSLILPAGTTVTVDVYADMKNSAGKNLNSGDAVTVYLDAGSANGQGQSSLNSVNVPNAAVHGNAISVVSSTIAATKYSGYGNQTIISGSNNALLGSFSLSTGSTEGISVNTIQVNMTTAGAATVTNLMLKDHATGTQLGQTVTTPSTTNSYSVSFDIPASQTKTIDVYGNILSSSNAGPIILGLDYSTGGTGDITGTSATIGTVNVAASGNNPAYATLLQTITVGSGSLAVALGSGNPISAIVTAGASQVHAGQWTFTSQYSPYTVDSVAVLVPANAATSVSAVTVSYKDKNGATQTATQGFAALSSGVQPYATVTFTGLTMYVPANSTANLDAYVGIPTIASGASTGAQISVTLSNIANAYGGNGFHALDSSGTVKNTFTASNSGVNSYDTSGQGYLVVRKSIPTLTAVPLSSTLTNATGEAIARVKVSADPAGDIGWGKMVFTVSKSAGGTVGVTLGATSTDISVYNITNGGNSVVNGFFATTTSNANTPNGLDVFGSGSSGGSLIFVPNSEQQVAAGSSATYELRAKVGGVGAGVSYVNVSIAANTANAAVATGAFPTEANTTGAPTTGPEEAGAASYGFVWSDRSSIAIAHDQANSLDWTNDYLLTGIPLTLANSSVTN